MATQRGGNGIKAENVEQYNLNAEPVVPIGEIEHVLSQNRLRRLPDMLQEIGRRAYFAAAALNGSFTAGKVSNSTL
jgi:hypothetical protein